MVTVEFDGLSLAKVVAGAERYAECLANYFAGHSEGTRVRVFTRMPNERLEEGVEQVVVTGPEDLAGKWLEGRMRSGETIYHLPYFPRHTVQLLPLALAARSVLTVHDLTFFHFPYLSDVEREIRLRRFELTLRWATAIVTNSEFTRRDVLNEFDFPEEKVEAVHLGVGDHFLERLDRRSLEEVRRRLDLPSSFLLTVGEDYPHKNLYAAVEAFAAVVGSGRKELALVMAGQRRGAEETARIDRLIRERGLEKKVKRVGYVTDQDLAALYQLAEVFVFPSLHEGFGFPVIEAMVSGTPVVATNRTSIPEVCGEAALLVERGTSDEIAAAVLRILEDDELRGRLIGRGEERGRRFSWDAVAHSTHRVYERILDRDFALETPPEEREMLWEEFHLLSFAEMAETRRMLEDVEGKGSNGD